MEGYEKLGYVALNVTDVARSRAFYETHVGLQYSGEGEGGIAFLRCSEDHHNLALYPSQTPGLKRVGFEMRNEASLDALVERLQRHEVDVVEVAGVERKTLRLGRSVRITEPFTGATFEFYVHIGQFSGQAYTPTVAKIQRVGYIVMRVPAFDEAFTGALGFRVSDRIDGSVCFMRCHPNPYHHGVAVGKGPQPMLHHINFMVTEVDDIGRAISRFSKLDVPIVNGPGRHPPSGSMFLYFLDPDGVTVEYSFGMEEFPAEGARKPRIMEPVRASIDYWDSFLDPRKGTVGAIETLASSARAAA